MSQFYTWKKEELGLDVPEMDDEHQILIDKMNALYAGVKADVNTNQLKILVNDLANYTVEHFADEEAYMESIGFEGLKTHKIIHEQLLKQFKGHVENFEQSGELSQDFFNFLKVWLTAHIRGIDMKYSKYASAPHKKAA